MYIFISHSSSDEKRVADIQRMLIADRIPYFSYESHILPGHAIPDEVLAAIRRATHMLLVVSHATLAANWVWYEVGVARGISLATARDIVLVPYRLDQVPLPEFVSNLRYVESLTDLESFLKGEVLRLARTAYQDVVTPGDQLDFHGFKASVKMIDFCKTGYKPENLRFQLLPGGNGRPPRDLQGLFSFKIDEWRTRQEEGLIYDHNDLIGVREYSMLRIGSEEEQGLTFKVVAGSYIFHRAAVDVFRGLPSERKKSIIGNSVHTRPLHGGHRFFGNILAVSIAVITSDGKIVFQRRSRSVAIDPGLIMCGIGEGMKQSDLAKDGSGIQGIVKTAIRGLREEFGVEMENPMECLKLIGFCLNRELFEWYVLGIVDLSKGRPKWDSQNVREAMSRDGLFEIAKMYFVPYHPESVFAFLEMHKNEMVNYGTATAISSMVSDWGASSGYMRAAALEVLESAAWQGEETA